MRSISVMSFSIRPFPPTSQRRSEYRTTESIRNTSSRIIIRQSSHEFGKCEETILPEKDIDQSLNGKGSVAYKAVLDGETVGGVIVAIDTETQHNHLDLLYVKSGVQGKGIGKSIWYAVEKLYPDTKVWETCKKKKKKRNIHFYVNICGFHITEFFNEKHPMLDTPDDFIGDGNEGMFVFQKEM